MKKIILSLLFLPMVLLFSCTDLDDVNERLDEHEERLNALETLVSNANTTINNLQKLVDAQGQKVSVVSYEALPNGAGYVLRMSDGSEITLKNGSDGQAPSVGVKEQDGTLYWTVNGEIMRDADGNPIKAEGQDGESGQTPKIRVNTDGEWEVSLDGGKTWQAILDENGNPVNAVGSDAQVDLEITEDENFITIIYDGQTFVIPKGDIEVEEPELPVGTDLGEGANCYIVSEAGQYYFVPEKVSGALIEGINTVDWIWTTKTDQGDTQDLISNIEFSKGVISFSTTGKKGSAIIAAFDVNNDIVWSWHIWSTDKPADVVYENGVAFMDRSLGAMEAGYTNASLGMLYQWGRKDPFFGGTDGEGVGEGFKQAMANTIMNPNYGFKWERKEEAANIDKSIKNPTTFFYGQNWDWIDELNNELWGEEKTDYDPSPAGYRLASDQDWRVLNRENFLLDAEKRAYYYTYNGTTTWWPCHGVRDAQDGELVKSSDHVFVWACTFKALEDWMQPGVFDYFGARLIVGPYMFSYDAPGNKSYAQEVRCVAIE